MAEADLMKFSKLQLCVYVEGVGGKSSPVGGASPKVFFSHVV